MEGGYPTPALGQNIGVQGGQDGQADASKGGGAVRLGICAMDKKVSSKPMLAILDLLKRTGDIHVIVFPESVILNDPVEMWPHPVDVLISFYSDKFPLDKAQAYVELRRPHVLNNLSAQKVLWDRRQVYSLLKQNGIPRPDAVVVERDEGGRLVGEAGVFFEEGDDFIKVGNKKVSKPFVEKPVDAEDHNICIYYPTSAGGGVKNLFRKVGDRSSEFDPARGRIRTDGTYMYEAFMQTQGTDIKVYTVGSEYAHAEARKSPVIDGVVQRGGDGKELRFPVVLTAKEKEIARRVSKAFQQMVCGFDLLRTEKGSFVIDVNGWSFVKGLQRYYEDAAVVLHNHMLQITGRRASVGAVSRPASPDGPDDARSPSKAAAGDKAEASQRARWEMPRKKSPADRWDQEELLAVLAVMRHGDRTPKNKMKLVTRRREFRQLHSHWATSPTKEVKLKAPKQLQEVLDIVNAMLQGRPGLAEVSKREGPAPAALGESTEGSSDSDRGEPTLERALSLDEWEVEGAIIIREVLNTGGHFDGIYRKVQLKPTSWDDDGNVEELVLVLKYGGILTPAGVVQAEQLGGDFRKAMYPGEEGNKGAIEGLHSRGLLRLHATQRHDFKVYSSDEGRVQMTAAAFTRGLLDLEKGMLTPICAALVQTDTLMLDEVPARAVPCLEEAKTGIHKKIHGDANGEGCTQPEAAAPGGMPGYSWKEMHHDFGLLYEKVEALVNELRQIDPASVVRAECAEDARAHSAVLAKDATKLDSPRVPPARGQQGDAPSSPVVGQNDIWTRVTSKGSNAASRNSSERSKMTRSWVTVPGGERVRSVCSTTSFRLVLKRWEKLLEDLWDKKQKTWNVSKGPEIHDAVKYDLIHHEDLADSFRDLFEVSKRLNDAIVPLECGADELAKAQIGGMVCQRLVRKLLIDMSNSLETPETEELPPSDLVTASQYLCRTHTPKEEEKRPLVESSPAAAATPSASTEEHTKEAEFAGLDVSRSEAELKSPNRRVRTRLYFTSESHIQTLMNVLRYCHLSQPDQPGDRDMCEPGALAEPARIVCPEAEERLSREPVFEYLSQIVFRLFQEKGANSDSDRYRVEVLFSPGAAGNPSEANVNHAMPLAPLEPLHESGQPLWLGQLRRLLGPFAEG